MTGFKQTFFTSSLKTSLYLLSVIFLSHLSAPKASTAGRSVAIQAFLISSYLIAAGQGQRLKTKHLLDMEELSCHKEYQTKSYQVELHAQPPARPLHRYLLSQFTLN
ncbi:hypothetical protein HOLleu_26046 [Holothuria leucospilota]|uniref:Uncharacterized protein n=1 Tax=Holothuria leucospilota TaxID=206669 RepID=A0A9Q1H285_HOLLE|nr:hypothetical protein HOLleu_26046 [Holothuria leucospilota]